MTGYREIHGAIFYSAIVLATYFFIQALIVVTHEFIHSTTAYLLGHMQDPFGIIWGNPLTLDGWDEGVSYSQLFAAGLGTDAAIIAVMPLVFHAVIVSCGLYLLLSPALLRKKWWFHFIFWLVIMNLMELIAYMPMRAFAPNGDIGNINHGLGLSPWVLFFPGTVLVLIWLYYLFLRVLPRAYVIIAGGSHRVRYVILCFSAFFVFDWRSVFRIIFYACPEPQWFLGLAGLAASGLVICLCRPDMPWVIEAEKQVIIE